MSGSTPEEEWNTSDRGDDVQRRFRYQSVYTGIVALSLLDANQDFETLYCEHFDDILIRCINGECIAIQVKTKNAGGLPWKSNDAEIVRSLQRFSALDAKFQRTFRRFTIVSNIGFWKERKDWHNLPHLLEQVKAQPEDIPLEETTEKHLKQLGKASGIDTRTLPALLRKVEVQNSPGLNDIELRLIKLIKGLAEVGNRRYEELSRIANGIITLISRASALSFDSPTRDFCALLDHPVSAAISDVVRNKRIAPDDLRSCISEHLSPETVLRAANTTPIEELPRGITRLEVKMAAGGISIANVELAADWKYSAEYFLNEWLYKLGTEQANAQYQQLSTIVRTEFSQAFDECFVSSSQFGGTLLSKIREALRRRFTQDKHLFMGCEYEHILGVVSILTEECKFWWSDRFSLPGEGST